MTIPLIPPRTIFLDRTTPPHVATLVAQASIAALAMNVFLPSLPSMVVYFDTSYSVIQLSVSLYLAVNAVLQVLIGTVSDRYGRRPVLLGSLVVFVIATAGTLVAPNITAFLIFRMMQALVVSAMVLSRASIRDVLDENAAASRIGYVTMGMAVVPMVAPAIGGFLDEAFGWRGSFILMLVAGVAVLALSWADMGETKLNRSGSLRAQFSTMPELMRARRFWGYCGSATLASGAFFAYLGGAPFVGSRVFELSPSLLGIYFGAPAVGYAMGNFLSGRYAGRFGINRMILTGSIVGFAGMIMLATLYLAGLLTALVFFGCFIMIGLGNGMLLPSATSGMMSVRPHLAGTASGIGGAIMIGGGAALSAIAGALLTPGSGAGPLVWMMLATTGATILPVLYVMRRERQIGA
ncbi:multidrug effflux MFS transporter [Roseinatronobacter alkalisoli]|uniref:Bcr/CflA family efflux transporter n=1 Tax=Roseinatronobacter alkalisoli TaxID=3028235 RepID=A0ABT5T5L4_9RHOB|nr:multidrug effflux MFS transporter [Roseinatronobacter sp. HJB301]MDD7970406.1 multidrug effflux MFS transporter [Roseinatronobacter sp. HJB301]